MDAYEALRVAAERSGVPLYRIGREIGKNDAYVNSAMSRGSTPRCDTMARMADVCGHSLALVPRGDVPDTALVIGDDPRENPAT